MRLLSLDIRDFRNLAATSLLPSPRATVLVGENGQGKTNLLEAVYYLTTLKALRPGRLQDLIRFGAERAEVAGDLEGPGGQRRAAVRVAGGARTAFLDGKPQESFDDYFEGLAAVAFTPDDLLLVKAGPEGRRRFLDRAAFNRWPAVLTEAREFLRALRARNAALRRGGPEVEESFRLPLARAGARLLLRRRALLEELAPRVRAAFQEISGPAAPEARLDYRPAAGMRIEGTEPELAERLAELLGARLAHDRERGYTTAGPQADDAVLSLDGRGARLYGSQGQQRALVLALKIAEIENLRAAHSRPPLLLLDDVSSELDPAKNGFLLGYLRGLEGQSFLTTTDARLLAAAAGEESAFFRVEGGVISPLPALVS
ncbi:MAG TPA: DNA replication and repair protein RecF [Anaeromyxobacter sp.]|nr:DNA replication and repair protein RecF [Anaeromyxobacter sp.]